MPKATIEFTLPEESEEHRQAVRAGEAFAAMSDFSTWLRNRYKHGAHNAHGADEIEEIRAYWWECVGTLLE